MQYKIKVTTVEEVEKAQTLFEKLGFRKGECTTYDLPKYVVTVSDTLGNYSTGASLSYSNVACAPIQMSELEEIVKNWSNDLISGQEAKIAWAYGEDIEYNCAGKWTPLHEHNSLNIFDRNGVIFRRKPTTVKLEIEVPAPFEPKYKEKYWFVNTCDEKGYSWGCFF